MAMPEIKRGLQCEAVRHLWEHGALAIAIYTKIANVTWDKDSHQYGTYHTSVEAMADFLGSDYSGTRRAFKALERNGWLERVDTRTNPFKYKDYRLVAHKEWAERHPDQCYHPEAMVWDGERQDRLAQSLWKASYGRTRWYGQHLIALRRSGKTDTEIVVAWQGFVRALADAPTKTKDWKDLQFKFIKQVKANTVGTPVPTTEISNGTKIHRG